MAKLIPFLFFLLLMINPTFGQSPVLVEDYILGPQGSVDNRIYQFQNTLTYLGTTQLGERAILQYDKETDEISVLAQNADFVGDIISISSNTEELLIFTGENNASKNLYRSLESDLSDIQNLYNSGEASIARIRIHQDHIMVFEENFDGIEYTLNMKVLHPDDSMTVIYENLPGRFFDYNLTAVQGHFLISPEVNLIEDQSILAFDIESRSVVPFTNIVPEFEECGLVERIFSLNDNIVSWRCEADFIYDLSTNQFIQLGSTSYFIYYDLDDHLFALISGRLFKIDKETGDQTLILDEIIASRGFFSSFFAFSNTGGTVVAHYFDFEDENLYSYGTDYSPEQNFRMTGFGIVPSGLHVTIYDGTTDNGVISSINANNYTEIDSVFNVGFNNRPVAYEEDIYFTHQDPTFGNELFLIDYEVTNTIDLTLNNPIRISPNPANTYIQVEHSVEDYPITTTLIDMSGKALPVIEENGRIDVHHLPSGMYFLRTTYKNGSIGMERFVVE